MNIASAKHVQMFAGLLPAGLSASERRGPFEQLPLLPGEAACVERAVPVRLREFATGRTCAREALSRLGVENCAIPIRSDRAPQWPPGIVGSITHTADYCAAVVGLQEEFSGIGIDAEEIGRVDRAIAEKICLPSELAWLDRLPDKYWPVYATVFFSAKEAFFKCQYPITESWLSFADVRLEIRDTEFTVSPLVRLTPVVSGVTGRFRIVSGLICSAIAVARANSA